MILEHFKTALDAASNIDRRLDYIKIFRDVANALVYMKEKQYYIATLNWTTYFSIMIEFESM